MGGGQAMGGEWDRISEMVDVMERITGDVKR